MKKFLFIATFASLLISSCHRSLDEQILMETQKYTRKECPKRQDEFTILDSLTYSYNDSARIHACHYTLSGYLDNDSVYTPEVVNGFRESVLQDIRTNLNYRRLRQHGVTFAYYYRSATQKGKEYIVLVFTPEDYN